jgi:transcriptional regulator with XRE-family HTH domain
MARRLGISSAAYYKNETGDTIPNTATLSRMEKEYDISMDWFLFGKGAVYYSKERQRVAVLEKELEAVKKELEQEREKLAAKEKELEVRQELRQLIEYMDRDPLLYHELMAYFERFKRANRESVESPPSAPQSPT